MKEIWKDIKEFEGLYQVSSFGKIRNFRSSRILKQCENRHGYLLVALCKNNKMKTFATHRIIAKAFIKNNNPLQNTVNHINGDKKNNSILNLEWMTLSENIIHSYRILHRKPNLTMLNRFGAKHKNSIPIIQKDLDGNVIKRFDSAATAGRELNKQADPISRTVRNEKGTAYGFIWEREVI